MKTKELTKFFDKPSMKLFTMINEYLLVVLLGYSLCEILNINKVFSILELISFSFPIIFLLFNKNKSETTKTKIIILILYFIIIGILPFIFSKTYDLTIDGNSYHKTAIAYLKEGWNPLYEKSSDFNNQNVVKFNESTRIDLWIDHYPKASWIFAANLYQLTGSIESGKCLSLILLINLFILAYNIFSKFMKNWASIIISILLVLNPIAINQLFTYYIDGIMGTCFAIDLLLLFLINEEEKKDYRLWISLICINSIFVNLKFTGLLCSGILAAIFYFYFIIKNIKNKNFKKIFINNTIFFCVVFVISIFFVGANSYVLNTIQHKNPLYPLIGKDKVDIITTMEPAVFNHTNDIKKFFWSLYSKTENITYYSGMEPTLKNPIRVYPEEVETLQIPDARIGGFGPLFGLTFSISIVLLFVGLIISLVKDRKILKYIIITMMSIIITIILIGEGWWARYIPQLYLIPCGTIVLLIYLNKYFNKKMYIYALTLILLGVLTLNSRYFIKTEKDRIDSFKTINTELENLSKKDHVLIKMTNDTLYGYYYNLNDYNINYIVVDELIDGTYHYEYSWKIEVIDDEKLYQIN